MQHFRISAILLAMLCLTGCSAQEQIPEAVSSSAAESLPAESESFVPTETETESGGVPGYVTGNIPSLHNFTAKTFDGGEITSEIFTGKDVTVLNIWQTTCPPCIAEMPQIAELSRELPDNVQFLTWCLDGSYEMETLQKILEDSGITTPTLISGDGDLIPLLTGIMYTPTTVFLDSKGNPIGELLIGTDEDAKQFYKNGINAALEELGLETIH